MSDYFPVKNSSKVLWLKNLKNTIPVSGAEIGLSPAEILEIQTDCTKMIDAISLAFQKKAEKKSAVQAMEDALANEGSALRKKLSRLKSEEGFTPAIGKTLDIISSRPIVDTTNYKPQIKAGLFGKELQIKFFKRGVDMLNLYHRKAGDSHWKFLKGTTTSPFCMHIILEVPGQPEHWEYCAMGVVKDQEVGIRSDIVEIVFGI